MQAKGTTSETVVLQEIDAVGSPSQIRHVDQLDERTKEVFYEAVESGAVGTDEADLTDGEVIVYTDYYRVTLV
ncbi:hypothetical protein [Natrialbaceae archaeon AArc-T1-2]|uniref:hypothetical protein n=1 Tax=Natrialbaceae archaeon AArc-T1-2 TaxID=3053904 RepID=UPI00255AE360|nr:hypothetical protein [Natrialbaceae archaeon AArc-T1-2]WIV68194.1 hypothetical protein QQ977_05555 [Natrialbaceae archaeon AArc-T1-2]